MATVTTPTNDPAGMVTTVQSPPPTPPSPLPPPLRLPAIPANATTPTAPATQDSAGYLTPVGINGAPAVPLSAVVVERTPQPPRSLLSRPPGPLLPRGVEACDEGGGDGSDGGGDSQIGSEGSSGNVSSGSRDGAGGGGGSGDCGGDKDANRGGCCRVLAKLYSAAAVAGRAARDALPAVSGALTMASPFLCLAAGVTALLVPEPFAKAITSQVVEGCLVATAAAMALTLTPGSIWAAATRPWLLVLSIVFEFGVAPAVAFALGHVFRLSSGLRAGLTLLGCTNGGQASNLATYIARGHVGLSVLMTLASSLLATVAIPGLSRLYLSGVVSVDAAGLAASTAKLVLAPLAAGVAVKAVATRAVDAVEPLLPVVGIAAVITVVLGSTALAAERIKATWSEALAPALLLFIVLFLLGYGVGRWAFRQSRPTATALAFEAGVKNPPLAFVLARRHFADPAVQTASAVTILVLAPLFMGAAVGFRVFINRAVDLVNGTPADKVLRPVDIDDLPAIPPLQSPSMIPVDGDSPHPTPSLEALARPPPIAAPDEVVTVGHGGKSAT